MNRIELPLCDDPVTWLEGRLAGFGLAALRMSLKKYPGSTHWHIVKPGFSGTLEATWWPSANQFWLEQRTGRTADWQDEVVGLLTSGSA